MKVANGLFLTCLNNFIANEKIISCYNFIQIIEKSILYFHLTFQERGSFCPPKGEITPAKPIIL